MLAPVLNSFCTASAASLTPPSPTSMSASAWSMRPNWGDPGTRLDNHPLLAQEHSADSPAGVEEALGHRGGSRNRVLDGALGAFSNLVALFEIEHHPDGIGRTGGFVFEVLDHQLASVGSHRPMDPAHGIAGGVFTNTGRNRARGERSASDDALGPATTGWNEKAGQVNRGWIDERRLLAAQPHRPAEEVERVSAGNLQFPEPVDAAPFAMLGGRP